FESMHGDERRVRAPVYLPTTMRAHTHARLDLEGARLILTGSAQNTTARPSERGDGLCVPVREERMGLKRFLFERVLDLAQARVRFAVRVGWSLNVSCC